MRRPLGSTGLTLPPLVFGTSSLGNLYEAYPFAHKRALLAELLRQVEPPVVIDTAGKYGAGLALEVLGQALTELAVDPADVIVINKLGWYRTPLRTPEPTFEPGAWVGLEHDAEQRIGATGILACHEQGCELLGGDYRPSLVGVHDPDEYLTAASDAAEREERLGQIVEALAALAQLRDAGEVVGIGVGAKDWRAIAEIEAHVPLDWVMLANSLTIYRHEPALLAFVGSLASRGVGILNAAVFHSGFVVGGDHFDYRPVDPSVPADAALLAWRERFEQLCRDFAVSPVAAALQFGSRAAGVAAVAAATDRPEQIGDLLRSLRVDLPPGFWAAARERAVIDPGYPA